MATGFLELEQLGELLVNDMASFLIANKKLSSGTLVKSLKSKVEDSAAGIELNIYGTDYAKFVDRGRKKGGKRVPISALVKWVKEKGLATGDKKMVQLAFAIQTNIWKNGIKPTPFIQFALNKRELAVLDKVGNMRINYISNEIDKLITKYWFDKAIPV